MNQNKAGALCSQLLEHHVLPQKTTHLLTPNYPIGFGPARRRQRPDELPGLLPCRLRASLISAPQKPPPAAFWEMKFGGVSAGSLTRCCPPPTATTPERGKQ